MNIYELNTVLEFEEIYEYFNSKWIFPNSEMIHLSIVHSVGLQSVRRSRSKVQGMAPAAAKCRMPRD